MITTGRISVATRQEGLKDADKIVSTISGSELVELCAKYRVGVKQHFSFDKSLLKLKEEEESPEPPLAKTVPDDLTNILMSTLKERFQRIGKSPFYKSKTKLVIARWSQRHKRKSLAYWYGLKARDLEAFKSQRITHFAYVCANKGVLLLPSTMVLKKIKEGALLRSPKIGPLVHYHIQLDASKDELKWILKDGIREDVEQYFHKQPRKGAYGRKRNDLREQNSG